MILFLVLILTVTTVTFATKVVAKGKTYSALGDYKIETTDNPVQVKGEEYEAFVIRYENSPMEVTVLVCIEKKCKKYFVLSDKLSVQYVNNPYYFGVEKLDKSLEQEGYKTDDAGLNRVEYFHQKVLGPGQISDRDATTKIAAFFPFLLNSDESMIAEKK